jgi:nicotinamide-nucleotide amidase
MTTAEKLVERLGELGRTCGTAESCTGGGIGSAITAVPGSSAVFMGGVFSYDNSICKASSESPPGLLPLSAR